MFKFYIITALLSFSNLASTADKNTTDLKSIKKIEKEGSLDLSSEIKESITEGKQIGTVASPTAPKKVVKRKKKAKKILRVESGPTETVQVPDTMEWDVNKKNQDVQIRKLRKELDGEVSENPAE